MYIRRTTRKNKDGSVTGYVQLAHNEWDKVARRSVAKVLLNLGRAEEVDIAALERLVTSIQKFLGSPAPSTNENSGNNVKVLSSKEIGGTWFLDRLWKRLELDSCISSLLQSAGYDIPVERAIFAMSANRALFPSSKLSTENWVSDEVYLPGLPEVAVHQMYRSMDFLVENSVKIQEDVFFSVASLMNLEVDLIYFDTTSTYFETDAPDSEDDESCSLRRYGHSKDHRKDLPQIVIGLAVTKEGIPVRCWVFEGGTPDVSIVEQVKKDLNSWKLGRVISVADRGFASEDNFIKLQNAGGHYIIGERMRSGKPEVEAALSKPGPYTIIREDLQAKEIIVGEGERRVRYALAYNPKEAKKDKITREKHLEKLREYVKTLNLAKSKAKAKAAILTHVVYKRFIKSGVEDGIEIDEDAIKREERLDGKYLIRTSDDSLSLEDIVLGYKQLLAVERGFRTMKTELDLRPVYHRKSERIRAHVLLCWLALLLVRVAENEIGNSWHNIRRELKKLHLVEMELESGIICQTTELTSEQRKIFGGARLKPPPGILSLNPTEKV